MQTKQYGFHASWNVIIKLALCLTHAMPNVIMSTSKLKLLITMYFEKGFPVLPESS